MFGLSKASGSLLSLLKPAAWTKAITLAPSTTSSSFHSSGVDLHGRNWKHDRGSYVSFFSRNQGKRRELASAADRFKRLDWGAIIRCVGGKDMKHWMKLGWKTNQQEQQVFLDRNNDYIVQRLLLPATKEKRYLPNDIYDKYHKTSFFKQRWLKLKNRENIKRSGSQIYKYTRYKAALSKHETKYNMPERPHYVPPGFLGNTAAHGGVYKPEAEFLPEDTPAPHFERPLVRSNVLMEDKALRRLRRLETFSGGLEPWNPLRKGTFKRW